MSDQPDLGEQALSKVVELGLSSQLDEVEQLNVEIRTDPLKLVQGKVDSVSIDAEGMVVKQDLRAESMQLQTESVAINPLSVPFGKVELTAPTAARASIVLNEADLNRALASDFLAEKLKNLPIPYNNQTVLVDIEQAQITLPGDRNLALNLQLKRQDTQESKRLAAVAKPSLADNGNRLVMEIVSAEAEGLELDFVSALFEQVVKLLDLRNFELSGMSLQLQRFEAQPGKLKLQADTTIEQFPNT